MTCTNGIDVVILHDLQIIPCHFSGYDSAAFGTEFMPVDTMEYNPFSIDFHDAIFNFEFTDSNACMCCFHRFFILKGCNNDIIQIWVFT